MCQKGHKKINDNENDEEENLSDEDDEVEEMSDDAVWKTIAVGWTMSSKTVPAGSMDQICRVICYVLMHEVDNVEESTLEKARDVELNGGQNELRT